MLNRQETNEIVYYRQLYLEGDLGSYILNEVESSIFDKESGFLTQDKLALIEENAKKYGRSPKGFFYKNELFFYTTGIDSIGVSVIADELNAKADTLKQNRTDIIETIVYISNFLSYINKKAYDLPELIFNLPKGIEVLSPAVKVLQATYKETLDTIKIYSRDDEENRIFFLHYDKIQQPLNRFLFRRIAR